ncbi:unnamed protein product [Bursaphelenchus okinawaensis]|uniref:Uncharacterized protein n=1 Tax=Bursaphelenchus okinawaensis TaxID=465554 RepID=A0A811KHB6_9BILA|nr:unnamed protein product [Bursaphelenchus okinawaensis]CAG9103315.1 unnamed protein product [Bursaphelenchus okinawaensis]
MGDNIVKETFEVSAAHPDKVVVNGCDLVNRTQLSNSQNRELQRFIDRNSHKLGFYDRPHDEKEPESQGRYSSLGFGVLPGSRPYGYDGADHSKDIGSGNRVDSPYSEYGTYGSKRKGVKFADGVDSSKAHPFPEDSFGLNNRSGAGNPSSGNTGYGEAGYGDTNGLGGRRGSTQGYGQGNTGIGDNYGKNRGGSGKQTHPDNYDPYGTNRAGKANNKNLRSRTQSPGAGDQFKWKPYQSYEYDGKRNTVAPPIPQWLKDRSVTPAYSALNKHPDNYNKYDTEKHRIQLARQSQEKDEEIKFYGFGDRLGSGIELTRKRWTGGELITDPTFVTKSIKPRTMFYSPIGDGCVAADGIELKRGPPDLTPKRYEYHERVVERGDTGHGGVRVTEKRWDDGSRRNGDDDDGGRGRGWPDDGLGDGRGRRGPGDGGLGDGLGDGRPKRDDDGNRGWPNDDGGWPRGRGEPFDGGDGGYPRSLSPLSIGTDGFPREGWTKTFITNPRELINQYGSETLTTIFDLKDHTPKTMTTVKETISPVP